MTDPISFTSISPRFGFPFLFAAQSQKEIFVNEAHSRADMLLHPSIVGELSTPPASAGEGDCWLVSSSATGDWTGHDGHLASMQSGNWLFAEPRNGMTIYDEAAGQIRFYKDGWQTASSIAEPTSGATIDTEARTAINGLIAALVSAGILSLS